MSIEDFYEGSEPEFTAPGEDVLLWDPEEMGEFPMWQSLGTDDEVDEARRIANERSRVKPRRQRPNSPKFRAASAPVVIIENTGSRRRAISPRFKSVVTEGNVNVKKKVNKKRGSKGKSRSAPEVEVVVVEAAKPAKKKTAKKKTAKRRAAKAPKVVVVEAAKPAKKKTAKKKTAKKKTAKRRAAKAAPAPKVVVVEAAKPAKKKAAKRRAAKAAPAPAPAPRSTKGRRTLTKVVTCKDAWKLVDRCTGPGNPTYKVIGRKIIKL